MNSNSSKNLFSRLMMDCKGYFKIYEFRKYRKIRWMRFWYGQKKKEVGGDGSTRKQCKKEVSATINPV